jgi:excinuclease ABC subunit A
MSFPDSITVRGAAEHNLRNVTVSIPRDSLCVITGLSGSGKSSLAFDTIYAEGQRRYMESLSAYARQFLEQMHKPRVEHIDGLSPAISIEQKTVSRNPRSTVGTVTEIYDYLRVLYANIGKPHCPKCGKAIEQQNVADIVERILTWPEGTKFMVLAPIVRGRKGEYRQELDDARRQGFARARIDGELYDLDDPPKLRKSYKHEISIVVDRLTVSESQRSRLTDSIELSLKKAEGLVQVETVPGGEIHLFSERFACPDCGVSIEEITHRLFSFNSPYGWCKKCEGIGTQLEVDESRLVPNPALSIRDGALTRWRTIGSDDDAAASGGFWLDHMLAAVADHYGFSLDTPYNKLPKAMRDLLIWGNNGEIIKVRYPTRIGTRTIERPWSGMIPRIRKRFDEEEALELEEFMRELPCSKCQGQRLRDAARAIKIAGMNIADLCTMDIGRAQGFFSQLELSSREQQIASQILKEISDRLGFLNNVGLHYLTLDRHAGTLSGGEAQRIRLATQIGSQLVGVLYVLDEPSIGLHQRDNDRLLSTLAKLRDLGNTVLVVEHDESTIRTADYVLDLGPGAGRLGGELVFAGTPGEIQSCAASLTGQYLRGDLQIEVPARRRKAQAGRELIIEGAAEHNLKDLTVSFPLGLFIGVTGVSGSGKSTLVNDILYRALSNHVYNTAYRPGAHRRIKGIESIDKVVDVDQSPIGRTPRSNPVTYTGVFSAIRDLFAQLPESKIRVYKTGRFRFNVKGGRCEESQGPGMIKVEMHFLPDVYVECQVCHGCRFNRETLEIKYKGKSIADVLALTVADACDFFSAVPSICAKMQTLLQVGLGYITLGQSAITLSGGEAQRVKLSKELSRRGTGKTVYILDEPTTGLHFEDIRKLIAVLQALVDQGNTVITIEHNLDVIKSADYLVDLGPEGGDAGGEIIAYGTPEKVAANPRSLTGQYLKKVVK